MKDDLLMTDLQSQAVGVLEKNHVSPQRYGTAFHVSPPWLDVRDIPLTGFNVAPAECDIDESVLEECNDLLSDEKDVYLQWQLAYSNVLGVRTLRVSEGQKEILMLGDLGFGKNRAAVREGVRCEEHQAPLFALVQSFDPASLLSNSWGSRQWARKGARTDRTRLAVSNLVIVVLEDGAELNVLDVWQNSPFAVSRLIVWQKNNSSFTYWGLRSGNNFLNEKVVAYMEGDGAQSEITHLLVGRGQEQADIGVSAYHKAPNTKSRLTVRAAGYDQALTLYRGLISVDKTAECSDGYQQGKALLLSSKTVVDLLPELDINTNEVRCSHGVSALHLDEQALFYLRSRGVLLDQAKMFAISGFFQQGLLIPSKLATLLEQIINPS